VEPVNAALLVLITVVAGIVAAFCARNLPGQHRTPRFSVLQIIVVLSLALCVTASSLPLLALGWMVAGLAVSGLVEHAGSKASKGAASLVRARLLLGDAALWVGIGFLGNAIGSLDIEDLFAFSANANPVDPASTSMTVAAFLLIVGGGVRSTLYPFHDWLPETAEAPTPVSALLHAGELELIIIVG
jgi:NADH:ubiquinone oxidoreductase subunit 5 (subunit L)/multisubunit Na+/H+ antiporter MnhA subunit